MPVMEELKQIAKSRGLWNLFLSKATYKEGVGLTNLEVCFSRLGVNERTLNLGFETDVAFFFLWGMKYAVMCEM